MAKPRLFELPETKGVYQLKGIVTGTRKDNFFKEGKTSTGKDMRSINFGVTIDEGKTLYVGMQAYPQDNVYYSKKGKKGEKSTTIPVPWVQRHTFNREGFGIIGLQVGVTKTIDAKGSQVNDKKTLVDYDACKEVGENLKDAANVFVKGKLEFSSFRANNGDLKKSTKLIPNQISLCGDIVFDDKYITVNEFTQTIVFTGIEQEKENDKSTGRFVVSAKIVTYKTIEDAEFIVVDNKLAQLLKKNLKPFSAIEVSGKLDSVSETESVESDDCWGEENSMTKANAPTRRELVITGAKPSSIDTETYSQKLIEEALSKIANANNAVADYGASSDGWGNVSELGSNENEDEAWD